METRRRLRSHARELASLVCALALVGGCASTTGTGGTRGARRFSALSTGEAHVCALRGNGEVACMAVEDLSEGAAGGAERAGSRFDTPSDFGTVVSLASGHDRTCVLLEGGSVRCFGMTSRETTVSPRDVADAIAVGMSAFHVAVVRPGAVDVFDTRDGLLAHATRRTADGHIELPEVATTTAAGSRFACATTDSGHAYCWGSNWGGECGNGGDGLEGDPVPVAAPLAAGSPEIEVASNECSDECGASLEGAARVVARDKSACVLLRSGGVACWGVSKDGSFLPADHASGFVRRPVMVADSEDATEICLGERHVCVLRENGSVACRGAIGHTAALTTLEELGTASAIGCTRRSVCAIVRNGRVRCVGPDESDAIVLR